ncbi:hypothetical protein B0180_04760 [Moraxella canis]|uniref:Uncharacterized protein n=2 Tax=Moraxella TaxID=475 RepID=A0A7Z0UZM7_MORCA|nr:hypothetical protein AO382_0795 [Moraxella catarrhalis]OOR84242.1 hypothetical protein B0180_04760 [Moraxella canis]
MLQTVSGFENCLPSKLIAPKIKVEPVGGCSLNFAIDVKKACNFVKVFVLSKRLTVERVCAQMRMYNKTRMPHDLG